jgi:hypothetical protein
MCPIITYPTYMLAVTVESESHDVVSSEWLRGATGRWPGMFGHHDRRVRSARAEPNQ